MRKFLTAALAALALTFAVPASAEGFKKPGLTTKKLELDGERLILARGDVDEALADSVVNALVALETADAKKPIYMVINSYGGSIPDGGRIVAALEATDVEVICVVDEKAYSMAAVILQYCDTRYVQKFADILFHPASYRVSGQEAQIDSQVAHSKNYLATFHGDVAARLGLSYTDYKAKIASDWWLTAAQAVKANAADSVVTAVKYSYEAPPRSGFLFMKADTETSPRHQKPMLIHAPNHLNN